jgi:hypothetical protein
VRLIFETKTAAPKALGKTDLRQSPQSSREPSRLQPKLREALFEDYEPIAALHARNGLAIRSRRDWIGLWKGNPVYERMKGHFPIGWVLETGAGGIVGLIANVPFAFHFQGRELLAAAACAWVVDPQYRRLSMRLLERLMSQERADLILSTTVSPSSEPVLKLFEWSRAPSGAWDRSSFWITNYRGFARSALRLKSAPMSAFLSYPVSAALYCRDLFRKTEPGIGPDAAIESCAGFDDRFDTFWEELKREKADFLLPCRTREVLAWHFGASLSEGRVSILTFSSSGRMSAYAIFDRQDTPACGLKRVRLVDFQALKGSENALPSAMGWMLRRCRAEGIHILENVGCWLERPGLPRLAAPYSRTLSSFIYYYKAINKDLSPVLRNPAVWAPTTFDGDASL